jgi:cytochrome P450
MNHSCLDARYADNTPLTPVEKLAHVTLLIQAGADTTATALGSALRFILTTPPVLTKVRAELDAADEAGKLSTPIRYDEAQEHLPYFNACIKETLRLHPPATNLFARVVPKGGRVIYGVFVPEGTEVTSHAYSVQRDKDFYGEDAEKFVPERWLQGEKRTFEMEAVQFTFGMGSRMCLGKDIAALEMGKVLPEVSGFDRYSRGWLMRRLLTAHSSRQIVRRFDMEVLEEGRYVVVGGVGYNEGFVVRLRARK